MWGMNKNNSLNPPDLTSISSLAGFNLRLSSGTLKPLTVDGGCPITATASDSVGILYPGERMDALVMWDGGLDSSEARLHISLDSEYAKMISEQNK
jgi:hypothetical protein